MPIRKRVNLPCAIERARQLRRDMTWPEKLFWSRIKSRQFANLKFRKQHPIGPFVVDFYCANLAIVIEIDGDSHDDPQADADRQRYLERLGLRVIRYTNDDVLHDLDSLMEDLEVRLKDLAERIPPLALPSREGNKKLPPALG